MANFRQLTDAMSGLAVILSSQFMDNEFLPIDGFYLSDGGNATDGMKYAIGDYLRVKYPDDWPSEERYDFKWRELEKEANPIERLFNKKT